MHPIYIEKDGEYTAINPDEISWINGRNGSFTVYLKTGDKVSVHGANIRVKDFIDYWGDSLNGISRDHLVGS